MIMQLWYCNPNDFENVSLKLIRSNKAQVYPMNPQGPPEIVQSNFSILCDENFG